MNEKRSSEIALQTSIIMSIIQSGEDYLGKLNFSYFHMENADGLHFSLGGDKILAIMLKPQRVSNSIINEIQELIEVPASTQSVLNEGTQSS